MSLVHFVAEPDVKAYFKEAFKKPKIKAKSEIVAPPISSNYTIVGQAFDYLIRFQAEFLNPGKTVSGPWVADITLEQLSRQNTDKRLIFAVEGNLKYAHTIHERFLATGDMNDNIIKAAILAAQIDCIYRTGIVPNALGVPGRLNVDDLRQLIKATDFSVFKAEKLCVLNPSFGTASVILNGADGDILIDDCLIDIKCSKNENSLCASHFNQLMGYYLCSKIGGVDGAYPGHRIERLGIYLGRRAELLEFSAGEILPEPDLPEVVEWFAERAIDQLALRDEATHELDVRPDLDMVEVMTAGPSW